MFNGIFSQFVTQTVENPPKLWADQTEKPPTLGGFGREIDFKCRPESRHGTGLPDST